MVELLKIKGGFLILSWSFHLSIYSVYLFLHVFHFSLRTLSILAMVVLNSGFEIYEISPISQSYSVTYFFSLDYFYLSF